MNIKELIEILKTFDQDLIVYLEDWNEQYYDPKKLIKEEMVVVKTNEHQLNFLTKEKNFLCLGREQK